MKSSHEKMCKVLADALEYMTLVPDWDDKSLFLMFQETLPKRTKSA